MKYIVTKMYEVSQEIEADSENEAIQKSYDTQINTKLIRVSVKRFDDTK